VVIWLLDETTATTSARTTLIVRLKVHARTADAMGYIRCTIERVTAGHSADEGD
jgi:hypothetical protein